MGPTAPLVGNLPPPFYAPIHKLHWGKHRIGEFAWHIQQYEASHPVTYKHTATTIVIEREKSPPPQLPLVLGDAIHNLRAALDMLACDLVRLNKGNTKNVYFPFAMTAKELDGQIKAKNFHRTGEGAVKLLHKIGPHHEGNKSLRALHDLDVMDKHQLILPVLQQFTLKNFRMAGSTGEMTGDMDGIGDGFSISAQPDDEFTWDSLTFAVLFGRDVPKVFIGKPVIQTLNGLADLVSGVIESFRALYVRHGSNESPPGPISNNGAVNGV